MSRRLQLAVLSAFVGVVLAAVPTAAAKPRLSLTEAAGAKFPDRAFVLTLPSARPLAVSDLRIRENGDAVTGVSVVPALKANGSQFGVVLAIDASESMEGKAIAGALDAAQLFVGHRAPTQQVAVVTFNSKSHVVLPFSADSAEILQALAHKPALAHGTHMYDAVAEGVSLLEQASISAGSVVVLSDGADTGSRATRDEVVAAAKKAHVRIFAVGLRSGHFQPAVLREIATAASGEFSEATSLDDLSHIYDELGTRLAHEHLVEYRSFQELGSKVSVSMKVKGVAGTATAGYAAPTIPPPVEKSYHRDFGGTFWTSPFTMIVFSVLVVGLVAFCVLLLLVPRRRSIRKRLAEFVSVAEPAEQKSVGGSLSSSVFDTTQKTLQRRKWWARFRGEVEIAEIEMNPMHILFWTALLTVALMWLFAVFFTFAALLLGLLVPVAVWGWIRRAAERKRGAFADQLPDNLAVLASALRAGHSLVGALSVVVDDAPEPARSEFRRVVADEQLGRPLDDALELVADRMNNTDLRQVALVAALQRETGGSTSEVLDRVVETVRERQELRRLVKTLTAAGRMSRWVVTFLPVALIGGIAFLNPGYLKPLFTHSSGRILFVLAAMLVIGGSLVIKRIVDIKV